MVGRIRELLMGGPASAVLVLLMLAGCLFLWIGVPLGWLWIGSQIQGSASLGTALMITMIGIIGTILLVVWALSWLNSRHAAIQERRDERRDDPRLRRSSALEVMLVTSAGIAVVIFSVWFFGFAGAAPLPLNIGF